MDGTPLADVASAVPAVQGEDRIGEVLDRRYRIDELIGEGGMAHVYRVTHTMIGKSLAAKVVRHELRDDEEVVRRFLREAQIVSSIKHPNVVDISDYGETAEGGAFCVMELLRGRTLAEAIDERGAFSPEDALGVALQICHGLHHSHETGVVHRDLKPQNIFICDPKGKPADGKEPVVKLIDFGVARAGNRITVAGAVLGTPEYMSPEQVRGSHIDAGADLYALGIILFELLTAAVPYSSTDVAVTMQSQLHAPTPKMTLVDPELAGLIETQALIERLMSKDRAARPGTAEEAAVLLQQAMASDLGAEAAERVMKSTLAIGSGGIGKNAALPPAPARPWSDRQMDWNPDLQSAAEPTGDVGAQVEPDPVDLHDDAPTRGRSMPWIIAATAMVVAGATIGGYAAMGGFRPPARPTPSAPTVEIVSAPVPTAPPASEASQVPTAVAGGRDAGEQTPPPGASVPVVADPDPEPRPVPQSEISEPASAAAAGSKGASKRPPRRPPSDKRKPSKPRPKKADSAPPSATPQATSKPAETPSPASSPPKSPPSPATKDGDLRNPFG
ncbi:MAG: protein kinase domain-containing protein [Nannocystaceae bacterium]|nr:protein kinase [bacterium]